MVRSAFVFLISPSVFRLMTTNASGMATTCTAYRCHGEGVGLSRVKGGLRGTKSPLEGSSRSGGGDEVSLLFVIRFLRVCKLASGCHGTLLNYCFSLAFRLSFGHLEFQQARRSFDFPPLSITALI